MANIYNVRDLMSNKDEWTKWLGTYNKKENRPTEEFYRVTEFYKDLVRQAGRERKYLEVRTKPRIPQYKYLSFNLLAESVDFGKIEFMNKNALGISRARLKAAKKSPLQEEQMKTVGPNVEARLFDYIIGRLDQDPLLLKPVHPYWTGGIDNLVAMFSYHVTYYVFGTLV